MSAKQSIKGFLFSYTTQKNFKIRSSYQKGFKTNSTHHSDHIKDSVLGTVVCEFYFRISNMVVFSANS